jgi:hypothetical protein
MPQTSPFDRKAATGCAISAAISSYVATDRYPDRDDTRIQGFAEQLWTEAGGPAKRIDWRAVLTSVLAERAIIDGFYDQVRKYREANKQ